MGIESKETKAIREIIKNADYSVYEDYSGRGMNGKYCIGFSHTTLTMRAISDLLTSAHNLDLVGELANALMHARTDAMGQGEVIYFPYLETFESDDE